MTWTLEEGKWVSPEGFAAASGACGLRSGGGPDLALVAARPPAASAALFTRNRVKAASVVLSGAHLGRSGGRTGAIVVNAGCANAATGPDGMRAAEAVAAEAARLLGLPVEQVLLASTGVIGVPLRARAILDALPRLVPSLSPDGFGAAAKAILTTDRRPKIASAVASSAGREVRLSGFAKGAGMVHPELATMLAFVLTDARASPDSLHAALRVAAAASFNRISVDGDTSTNDSVFALASGASGAIPTAALREGMEAVCRSLALQIVRDGEGATRLLEVEVRGALTTSEADAAARTIASSLLVRTAVAGGDPNWGRVLAALGRCRVPFDLEKVRLSVGDLLLFEEGRPSGAAEKAKRAAFDASTVSLRLDLQRGKAHARFWTCDLTEEYVRVNARYTT